MATSLVSCLDPLPEATSSPGTGGSSSVDASGEGSGGSAGAAGSDSGTSDGPADVLVESSDECSDTTAVDYAIRRLPVGTTLASPWCNESFWASVPKVPLGKHVDPSNPSDNVPSCKLVWLGESKPNVVWGCCEVTDKDIRGTITAADGQAWKDDSVEVMLKAGPSAGFDATATKITLSVAGGFQDSKWTGGIFDANHEANVLLLRTLWAQSTLNDSVADKGYTIKWRANLSFPVAPGQRARCDFKLADWDGSATTESKKVVAFGTDHVLDMATAGVCRFSCDVL